MYAIICYNFSWLGMGQNLYLSGMNLHSPAIVVFIRVLFEHQSIEDGIHLFGRKNESLAAKVLAQGSS